MTDRDLIAEGRAKLAALEESPSTDRAFDLALWAGQNLAVLLAELEAQRERVDELAAQRNPDDEVLVGGSWFHPNDLPKILGNYMRSADDYGREAKEAFIQLEAARARVAELTTALAEANDARMRHLGVNERLRTRIAKLEAAQRPPLGYVVLSRNTDTERLQPRGRVHPARDAAEDWQRHLESTPGPRIPIQSGTQFLVAEVREVQP